MPLPRRQGWHRTIAEALLAAPAPDPDAVADHFLRAGDPRAAAWLIRAGERAQRAYAWLTAADRFEAALTVPGGMVAGAGDRAILLYRIARMGQFADPRRGIPLLEESMRLAEAADDMALVAAVRYKLGNLHCIAGNVREGLTAMEAGVAAMEALPAAAFRARDYLGVSLDENHPRGDLVLWLGYVGRYRETVTMGERFVDRQTAPRAGAARGISMYADACTGLAHAHAAFGRPEEAQLAFVRANAAYRAVEHHANLAGTLGLELCQSWLLYRVEDVSGRRHLAAEAERVSAVALQMQPEFLPRAVSLPLLFLEGAWGAAREVALAVRAVAEDASGPRLAATRVLGAVARARGEAAAAWALVREVLPAGPATAPGDTMYLEGLIAQRLAATLALDAGDQPTARAWLTAHDAWLDWSGAVLGRAEGQLGWAACHRAAGNLAAAQQAAERALAHATEPRQPLALLAAHRLLGELASDAGRHADAARHLATALALAEACAAPYERALTLLALAELRTATGHSGEVAPFLAEARAILEPLEAAPALARAAALAARLATSPPPAPHGPAGYPAYLSAREVEVLRLVAAGLTNPRWPRASPSARAPSGSTCARSTPSSASPRAPPPRASPRTTTCSERAPPPAQRDPPSAACHKGALRHMTQCAHGYPRGRLRHSRHAAGSPPP